MKVFGRSTVTTIFCTHKLQFLFQIFQSENINTIDTQVSPVLFMEQQQYVTCSLFRSIGLYIHAQLRKRNFRIERTNSKYFYDNTELYYKVKCIFILKTLIYLQVEPFHFILCPRKELHALWSVYALSVSQKM
jgi:hypothetical protein